MNEEQTYEEQVTKEFDDLFHPDNQQPIDPDLKAAMELGLVDEVLEIFGLTRREGELLTNERKFQREIFNKMKTNRK